MNTSTHLARNQAWILGKIRNILFFDLINQLAMASGLALFISMPRNILNSLSFHSVSNFYKGWLAIAKLKLLSLFISLLFKLKKAFEIVKIEK